MSIIDEVGLKHIDYFSLDVEGAEISVLRAIDFERLSISVLGVEDNHGTWLAAEKILTPHGYTFLGNLETDGFFIHSELYMQLGEDCMNIARQQISQRKKVL